MTVNFFSATYLFFRLCPFILVCFFALGSIINSELKGIVYLVGLFFAMGLIKLVDLTDMGNSGQTNLMCDAFSANKMYGKNPASLAILTYTFFYLLFPIIKHKILIYNIPTILLFPLLILADLYWNQANSCFSLVNCIATMVIAGGCGLAWSAIIDQTKMPALQYYNVGTNKQVCSMPTKTRFKCVTN